MQQRLQKVHQIVSTPEYKVQDIHIEDELRQWWWLWCVHLWRTIRRRNKRHWTHHCIPRNPHLNKGPTNPRNFTLNALDSHPDKIYAKVKINGAPWHELESRYWSRCKRNHYHRPPALPFSDYHSSMQQCFKRIRRLRDREHWCSYLKRSPIRASQLLSNSTSWKPQEDHPCWVADSHKTWE